MPPVQGAQASRLTLHIAGYVRPPEMQNADRVNLARLGEGMLSDIRRLVRADATFGTRALTRIAQSWLLGGASNDGGWDDAGAYVVQPVELLVYWTNPDDLNTAIEAVVKACKSIKRSGGYRNTVKYVSRRMTDPDDLPTTQIPAVWVLRPLGGSEGLTYLDD